MRCGEKSKTGGTLSAAGGGIMAFTLEIRKTRFQTVIKPSDDMVGRKSLVFAGRMRSCEEPFAGDVVMDLSSITSIDSHGISVLVYWWKRLKEEGREFMFVDPHPAIGRKLQLTGLDQIIQVVDHGETRSVG